MTIGVDVSIVDDSALIYFDNLPDALRERMNSELVSFTELVYQKVIENLSGAVLNEKTGQLRGSIVIRTEVDGDTATGFVGPEPTTPKALALEYGGKGYYTILPTKSTVLRFLGKEGIMVFAKSVNHPPSKEYRYLRLALEELEPTVEGTWVQALESAVRR